MYGYNPSFAPEIEARSDIPNIEQRLEALDRMRKETKASLEVAVELMKRKTVDNEVELKEGQKVWLSGKNITTTHPKDKLAPKLHGLFEIEKKIGPITFKLKLPPTWKIHPVFHASLITPYKETIAHGPNYEQPPPDLIEGKEEYEVEEILDKRKQGHGFQYLVKWKGYPNSSNEWITRTNLGNAKELVEVYDSRHSTNIPLRTTLTNIEQTKSGTYKISNSILSIPSSVQTSFVFNDFLSHLAHLHHVLL